MRKKPLILVAFLMMLYIAPMIFISSYSHAAIPTEQNMSKEFSISEDWYNASWLYRKSVTITVDSGIAGTDYQVLVEVPYDTDMQADFADIIFVDEDHDTLFDHWLQTANATVGTFWVEVQDYMDSNSDTTIYMYYGNDTVESSSNGTATFQFYEDWSEETLDAEVWYTKASGGTYSFDDTDAHHGSVFKLEGNEGANTIEIESLDNITAPTALMFRALLDETAASYQRTRMGMATFAGVITAAAVISSTDGTNQFLVRDDYNNLDHQNMDSADFDSYFVYDITRDGTNAKLYKDGALIETGSCDPDEKTDNRVIMTVKDSECDLYSDWIVGRKFIPSEPYVSAFGEEEPLYPPTWEGAGTAIILFRVPVFTGSLDALLIIAGLVMIPASTLYLVKGGKDEMSSDKFFYFCITFILGWALFLGGIM